MGCSLFSFGGTQEGNGAFATPKGRFLIPFVFVTDPPETEVLQAAIEAPNRIRKAQGVIEKGQNA